TLSLSSTTSTGWCVPPPPATRASPPATPKPSPTNTASPSSTATAEPPTGQFGVQATATAGVAALRAGDVVRRCSRAVKPLVPRGQALRVDGPLAGDARPDGRASLLATNLEVRS